MSKNLEPGKNALARASALEHPIALKKGEAALLREALFEGQRVATTVEAELLGYGGWLLLKVFDEDTGAALDDRSDNPVWLELLRRAGGPTLKLGRQMLRGLLRMAAWDRRITDEAFRGLDRGRKELLLPLDDARAMRDAARHVSDLKLSQDATRAYVATLRAEQGKPPATRITPARLQGRLRRARKSVMPPNAKKRIERMAAELSDAQRDELLREAEGLMHDAEALVKLLRR